MLFSEVVMMVVPVMGTACRFAGQLAVQVGLDQSIDRLIGKPGHDVDALLGKERQGAMANATGDDELDSLTLQPAGKSSRLVFGRRQRFGAEGRFILGVHFDHCKVAAAAEMRIQAAVINGDGDFHNYSLFLFIR